MSQKEPSPETLPGDSSDIEKICVCLEGTVGLVCKNAFCKEFAELDTFLVEAVDVPDEALEHNFVLKVGEQGTERLGIQ